MQRTPDTPRVPLALAFLAVFPACGPEEILAPERSFENAPIVLSASATCTVDGDSAEWVFDAEVDDGDGLADIQQVYAYVYDETTDVRVASFALAPTDDPAVWEHREPAGETSLNCAFRNYSVDFLATDSDGNAGQITAWAQTGGIAE